MLIPVFRIEQTDTEVIFYIRLPYVKISSADIFIEDNLFRFFLHPYYLSLHLKQKMRTDGITSCVYDHNTYYLTVKVDKEIKGEYFEDLDVITTLIKNENRKKEPKRPLIEVISETIDDPQDDDTDKLNNDMKGLSLSLYQYGFNNSVTNYFKDLKVNL